jgi:hypothetical protein
MRALALILSLLAGLVAVIAGSLVSIRRENILHLGAESACFFLC